MSGNNGKISAGRARGHSMYSTLKATSDYQAAVGELQVDHAGISAEHLRKNASPEFTRGPVAQDIKTSLLTAALQSTEPGIATSELIEIKDATNLDTAEGVLDDEQPLRKWCTGQPPKKSFLGAGRSVKLPFMRRSTLADKPELDVLLALTKKSYKGHSYLPLTAHTIRRLSPFWKGEKPIADTTIFDCVMIDHEINGVHADHVVAALERIGTFCKHLLVMSGVKTSELGTVFNRESGNVTPGNDWDCILSCFPNLKHLVFIHPVEEPIELSRGTLLALHLAIAKRQGTQEMMRFGVDVPAKLITHLTPDMASYHSNNSN